MALKAEASIHLCHTLSYIGPPKNQNVYHIHCRFQDLKVLTTVYQLAYQGCQPTKATEHLLEGNATTRCL